MSKSKGEKTRLDLLEKARLFFNEEGNAMTLEKVASGIGVHKSLITNHFSTKDQLFVGIFKQYEGELQVLFQTINSHEDPNPFQHLLQTLQSILDLQFKYRCGVLYLNQVSGHQVELKAQLAEAYARNKLMIRKRMEHLVEQSYLHPRMLDAPHWEAFLFVYVSLLTHWVSHKGIYDPDAPLDTVKSTYLRGVFQHSFGPYLTDRGWSLIAELKF